MLIISVKLLAKYVTIMYALDSGHEQKLRRTRLKQSVVALR